MMVQNIEWWHSELEASGDDHEGNLNSSLAEVNATYGISGNWNLSVDVMTGIRSMDFYRDANIHHRDENKKGMGDTRITLRYLVENTTFGPGQRIFIGGGLVFPSSNSLTENPFALGSEGKEHSHFNLSEGVVKGHAEFQYFRRSEGSIFPGGVLKVDVPLETNQYGFKPGVQFSGAALLYFQTKSFWGGIPFFQMLGQYRNPAIWDGEEAPNSGGSVLQLGGGLTFATNGYLLTVSARTPVYFKASVTSQEEIEVTSKTDVWGLSLSIRKSFSLFKLKLDEKSEEIEHDESKH
jgi:hypothetical protein